ncbi:MAG: class II aldolase/adducin family protein [Thermomicrobium sp.]|nr:class II aldolase/adducin family protein [Thermomicrobium sp.]
MPVELVPHQSLITLGRLAGSRGYLWGTGGNFSVRRSESHFLITMRGTALDQLDSQDFVLAPLQGGPGEPPEASTEIQLHRRVYQARPDVRCVVHLSPPYTTLVACSEVDLPTDLVPETALYLGEIARVPYIQPGTDELAQAVAQALGKDRWVVLLQNHGVVAVGETPLDAFRRVEVLEFLCRMVVTARCAGLVLHGIGAEAVAALRRSYGAKARG